MLEYFVHLEQSDSPDDLVLASAEVPDDLSRETVEAATLPANWRDAAAPPELTRFGDEFVRDGAHCLLLVPSVFAPSESNCLINPAHPAYKKIVVRELETLTYDSRMFRKQPSRRRRH
jgi:RES domain-containing protein